MKRAALRLEILRAVFHPGKNVEQMTEIVRDFETKLFGDLAFEDDEAPKKPAPGTKPAR